MERMIFKVNKIIGLLFFITVCIPQLYSASLAKVDEEENIKKQQFQREKEIIESIQSSIKNKKDIALQKHSALGDKYKIYLNEKPCFQINQVELIGKKSVKFQTYLNSALDKINFQKQCIGTKSIKSIIAMVNNEIINAGYITTLVTASSQNLHTGILNLTIIPGKIDKVLFKTTDSIMTRTKIKKFSAFPFLEGKILNLRDIEQGLENISRDATAHVDIQIVPSTTDNASNILIKYSNSLIPIRFQATVDDTGNASTGKYQGGMSLYLYNPLGINDLLYGGISRNLSKSKTVYAKNPEGKIDKKNGRTNNFYFGYSFSIGPFLFDYFENSYEYDQAVVGAYQIYKYSGNSANRNIKISYMFYRNQKSKYSTYIKGWERFSKNFIEDVEVDNQRRKTVGYELGVVNETTYKASTIRLEAALRQGTGARGALLAPEEQFGEGTSRMRIYTLDLLYSTIFFEKFPIQYEAALHVQLNGTPLTSQDRVSIGGRSTVRGFDGSLSLSAEKGAYLRNTLSYRYYAQNRVYLGIDVGHLYGSSTKDLIGQTLVGSVVGLKGTLKFIGDLSYNFFVGTPLYKPKQFQAKKITLGFNLSYDFK